MPEIQSQPMPEVIRRFNTSQRRELAKIARSNKQMGPRTVIVQPGDDIQLAINSIANDGGGVVLLKEGTHILTADISGKTEVSIVGEGRDLSIIECNGNAYGLDYTGTSGIHFKNFRLADFTIQNSNNTAGIDIAYCDSWKMDNVKVTSCDQIGCQVDACSDFQVFNSLFSSNTSDGLKILGSDNTYETIRFVLQNVIASSNTSNGFNIAGTNANIHYGTFINCISSGNGVDGFDISDTNATAWYVNFISCVTFQNSGIGFDVSSNVNRVSFIGCRAENNTGDGFETQGSNISIIGCSSNDLFDINGPTLFVGNITPLNDDDTIDPLTYTAFSNVNVHSDANLYQNTRTSKKMMRMKNNSGGSLAAGDVVILDSVASGDNITTTTTGGNDKVFGLCLGATASGEWGNILVEGYTTVLKVNGTTDIAIGDFLSTFTSAKIAQKASAGDMCFAVALEAYTTDDSSGVIDALLFSPRLI